MGVGRQRDKKVREAGDCDPPVTPLDESVKKAKEAGALLSQQRYVLYSETKISKLITDRDQCVHLELSEGVIPHTLAI